MLYEGAPGCGACPPNPGRYVCGCAQALVPAQRPADPGICFPDSSPPRALVPRAEMLLRDLVLRRGCCWSSLLLHCALHPLWGFVQVSVGVRTVWDAGLEDLLPSRTWGGGVVLHSHDPGFLQHSL